MKPDQEDLARLRVLASRGGDVGVRAQAELLKYSAGVGKTFGAGGKEETSKPAPAASGDKTPPASGGKPEVTPGQTASEAADAADDSSAHAAIVDKHGTPATVATAHADAASAHAAAAKAHTAAAASHASQAQTHADTATANANRQTDSKAKMAAEKAQASAAGVQPTAAAADPNGGAVDPAAGAEVAPDPQELEDNAFQAIGAALQAIQALVGGGDEGATPPGDAPGSVSDAEAPAEDDKKKPVPPAKKFAKVERQMRKVLEARG